MTPQTLKPETKTIKGFQPIAFIATLSLILAFVGCQVYYLIETMFAR